MWQHVLELFRQYAQPAPLVIEVPPDGLLGHLVPQVIAHGGLGEVPPGHAVPNEEHDTGDHADGYR